MLAGELRKHMLLQKQCILQRKKISIIYIGGYLKIKHFYLIISKFCFHIEIKIIYR